MVEPLESLLNNVKTSDVVRDGMFDYCVRRGYYSGVPRDEARRQFVADISAGSQKARLMAEDFVPSYLNLQRSGVRANRSAGVVAAGAVAYAAGVGFGVGVVALAGAAAVMTGGLFGAYVVLKRLLR